MPKTSLSSTIAPDIPPLPTGLRLISGLNDSQMAILLEAINKAGRYNLPADDLSKLRAQLTLPEEQDVSILLASLDFLYRQSRSRADRSSNWAEALKDLLQGIGLWHLLGKEPEVPFNNLKRLLAQQTNLEMIIKREWLQTGIVDRAVSFASFVDLRPNYNAARTKIDELVPMILFSIDTQSPGGGEQSFVFQMTLGDFNRFTEALKDVAQKVVLLKNSKLADLPIVLDEGRQ